MYEIARYYPRDVLEQVAAKSFRGVSVPRLEEGDATYCPLGYANTLLRERYPHHFESVDEWEVEDLFDGVPGSDQVADVLKTLANGDGHPYADELVPAALTFITDFDNGQITDLRAAFGLV
jgi:hypothetical protein